MYGQRGVRAIAMVVRGLEGGGLGFSCLGREGKKRYNCGGAARRYLKFSVDIRRCDKNTSGDEEAPALREEIASLQTRPRAKSEPFRRQAGAGALRKKRRDRAQLWGAEDGPKQVAKKGGD